MHCPGVAPAMLGSLRDRASGAMRRRPLSPALYPVARGEGEGHAGGCLVCAGLILLPITASAAPQIRTDPDDTSSIMDIYRVTTAQHVRRTYFGISSYNEALAPTVLYDGFWEFQLDTKRGGEFGSTLLPRLPLQPEGEQAPARGRPPGPARSVCR